MSIVPRPIRDGLERMREGEPGSRFQERFRERQKEGKSTALRRWLFIGGGTLVLLAGIFFLPAPGPGFLIIFLGGGLIAQESLVAARALDWLEVRLRAIGSWALRIWKGASMPVRVLLIIVGAIIAGGAAYVAYLMMFAR